MTRRATTAFVAAEAQGKDTQKMEAGEAQRLIQTLTENASASARPDSFTCPFARTRTTCTKPQPICSVVSAKDASNGELVAVCPARLALSAADLRKLATFVGLIKERDADSLKLVSEVSLPNKSGRIDYVLLNEASRDWLALEVQTVYTSGGRITEDLKSEEAFAAAECSRPFVINAGHPDFRSSGPKRLVPQLQDKAMSILGLQKPIVVLVDAWWHAQCLELKALLTSQDGKPFVRGTHHIVWAVVDLERGRQAQLRGLFPTTLGEVRSALQSASSFTGEQVWAAIEKRAGLAGEQL